MRYHEIITESDDPRDELLQLIMSSAGNSLLSAGFRWPETRPMGQDLRAQIDALDDDEVQKRIAIMRTHQVQHQPEQTRVRKPAPPKPTNAGKPKPDPANIADAIDHADHEQLGWTRKDFTIRYEGYLSVDEIEDFDDLSGWLEADEPDDLVDYRKGSFRGEAREMPPIIVITAPDESGCHTQIGDGRGRVNFANAHGLRLHVWHLIHKKCRGA